MEHYLQLVLEQIRCKKAHPYIKEELQGHIEQQIVENMKNGMFPEDAEKAAVKDMGDPVEVGISLDGIHKPQVAWGMIALLAVISVIGSIIHQILSSQVGEEAIGSNTFVLYTIVGFGLMLLVYRIDYSVIARYAKFIAVVFLALCVCAHISDFTINGTRAYNAMFSVMTLYVPLYGAILYKYRGQGYLGIGKALLWMIVPVIFAYKLPCLSLALLLLVAMLMVLTLAISQGWFQVSKKRMIGILWGSVVVIPAVLLMIALKFELLYEYQIARLQSFLTNSGDGNYVTARLRENLVSSYFVGNSGKEVVDYLPNFNNDYLLSYVFSTHGFLLGVIICCGLVVLICKIFAASFKQKNQLGMCMGCGCGIVFLLNVLLNIGENIGLLPVTQTFLPFFSTGGSNIIVCYILMGIVLSIYRYKNVYPAHINTKLPAMKITIEL